MPTPRRKPTAKDGKPARKPAAKPAKKTPAKPRLLAGGNPQIAKADGEAPVQAYIAAMSGGGPGWKRDLGRRLDDLITAAVPNLRKAVKWNSPFYGLPTPDGKVGWFLSFHCFAKYVKVAFFRGAALRPLPPGVSTQEDVRYLDLHEPPPPPAPPSLDEAQFTRWVKQASRLPGWDGSSSSTSPPP